MCLFRRKSFEGHSFGVSYLAWSPDGRYLLSAGHEDCPDIWIWNMEVSGATGGGHRGDPRWCEAV